ncbi:hypothetical protein MLD38_036144 [Melastoma candidum]|uniref:Uncharacterized protein n=1 Tax=Melastoma candidum TaxID=119954 RepID=A0ACB9LJC0_9MYRT|nr:hypothetical protein MLD38_036144 [Melastoma candidum]
MDGPRPEEDMPPMQMTMEETKKSLEDSLTKWIEKFKSEEESLTMGGTSLRPKFTLLCRRLASARRTLRTLSMLDGVLRDSFNQLGEKVDKLSSSLPQSLGSDPGPPDPLLLSKLRSLLHDLHKLNGMLSLKESSFSDPYPRGEATVNPSFDPLQNDPFSQVYKDRDPHLDSCASADFLQLFQGLDHRGKYFLLCFSVFPPDTYVDKSTLTYWCMAMGVLHPSENLVGRAVDRILEDLVVKGFVEAEKQNFKLVKFKLCPFVRCFVVKVAERFGFCSFDDMGAPASQGGDPSNVFLTTDGLKSSLDDFLGSSEERLQKVECVFNVNELFPDFDLPNFEKMKKLRALCLGRSSADQHIEIQSLDFLLGLKAVKNLTVLSLRGMSQVVRLPDALCEHADLSVLDLHACHNLEMLPEGIGSLVNLTHLDISKCYLLEQMPKGVASLVKLRVLNGFLVVLDEEGSCPFSSLSGLKKLNKLSLYINKTNFPSNNEQQVFCEFTLLRDFNIQWGAVARKKSKQPEVEQRTSVQERRVSGGLLGGTGIRPMSKSGSGYNAGDVTPSRNEGPVTETDERLEGGPGDRAAEVRIDMEKITTAPSLGKGLGEPSAAVPNPKPIGKGVLSRLPTFPLKKDSASKTTEPRRVLLGTIDKLVLQCFPPEEDSSWLVPSNMPRLKQLHIKGGGLRGFDQAWKDGTSKLEMLRLNYLKEFEMDGKDLLTYFPKLSRLAKVVCPKLSGFPADNANIRIPLRG